MSKLINVSNEIYEELKRRKGDRSFSIVIKNLLKSKRTNKEEILEFAGKGDLDEKEIKVMKKEWKKWSEQYA